MNKLKILIAIMLLIPSTSFAAFGVGFNATSTTQGWISPNLVNGVQQTISAKNFIGLNSITSYFPYASTTAITATTGYFTNLFMGVDTIAEYISDTAGAFFTGNTETGLSLTYQDADNTVDAVCNTASGSVFGCLSSTDWTTFNNKQATITAGDGLTLTGTDIDFDGGDSPQGELGGTWASPTINDSLAVTSWNLTTPTLTSFFGTPCTGNEFLQDIGDTGTFSCAEAAGGSGGGGVGWATTTANNEDIYSYGTGNVGIGSSTPYAKLSVEGNSDIRQLVIKANGTQTANIVEIQNSTGGVEGSIGLSGAQTTASFDTLQSPVSTYRVGQAATGAEFPSTFRIAWTNAGGFSGIDTGIGRNAAGVVEVNNGTLGTLRDIIVRNNTSTNATTSALDVTSLLTFGGVTGDEWSDFCESITGGSGLCDGTDNTGSGGAGLATSTDIADTYVIYGTSASDVGAEAAFTYDDALDRLTVVNASTTDFTSVNATTTNLRVSGTLYLGSDAYTDLHGSGLSVTNGVLDCDTGSGSAKGCLTSVNWTTFNNKWDLASTTIAVPYGGTGATTLTGLLQGNGTGAITGITNSSTVGQILRVTGASTYAWGALDLADTDAVTGFLSVGNIAGGATDTVLTTNGADIVAWSKVANSQLANSTISGIALGSNLANLTATDSTLTFSGTYNGSTARTIGLNLGNANTWTALQTFGNSTTTNASFTYASSTLYYGAGLTNCASENMLTWTDGRFGCESDTAGEGGGGGEVGGFTQLATSTSMSIDICSTDYATSSINALGVGTANITVTMSGSACLGKQIFVDVWAPLSGLIGTTTFSGVYWNGQINPGSAVINGLTDRFMFAVTASSTTFISAKLDSSY